MARDVLGGSSDQFGGATDLEGALLQNVATPEVSTDGATKGYTDDRFAQGTLSARPTAVNFGVGIYYATDDNGGTSWLSDGATWTLVAPRGILLGSLVRTSNATIGGPASFDVTGLTGLSVTSRGRPYVVTANLYGQKDSTASYVWTQIMDTTGAPAEVARAVDSVIASGFLSQSLRTNAINDSSGTVRTFKVAAQCGSGQVTFQAGTTFPAKLEALEV